MIRPFSRCLAAILATLFLVAQANAGPRLLPRLRLPKVSTGRAVRAMTYPMTKSVVNGGKTMLKTAAAAETLGVVPSIGPPAVNTMAKKIIVGVGRR